MTVRSKTPLVALPAAMAMVVALAAAPPGQAADHLDAPGGMSPGGDAQADINDLYAFAAEDDDSSVLAMTVHPVADGESTFGSDVLYQFNVDTGASAAAVGYDSDGTAEISYDLSFSDVSSTGSQSLYVTKTVGDEAPALVGFGRTGETIELAGGGQLYTGLRSDPFFFDLLGFQGTVSGIDTGQMLGDDDASDFFAPLDVLGIVLEVPDSEIEADDGPIAVWGTTSKDGVQVDRMGRPAINTAITDTGPLINADEVAQTLLGTDEPVSNIKAIYNSLSTAESGLDNDVVVGLVASAVTIYSSLDAEGSYSEAQLGALADVFLPDVLPYDKDSALPSPVEGRALEDDVIDVSLRVLTGGDPLELFDDRDADGGVNSDGIGPHDDYQDSFPYLGEPNGTAAAEVDNASAFHAPLSGDSEVPSVATEAGGAASLSVSDDSEDLSHLEIVYDLEDAVAAHIHVGGPDENGPVVAFLFGPSDPTDVIAGRLADGEISGDDLAVGDFENLIDVMSDGFAYVNVHTSDNPGGEIRGQVNALTDEMQFSDVGGVNGSNVGLIAAAGITVGCNADGTLFCPTEFTTRGQMAAFFTRALGLPATTEDFFSDDDGTPFEDSINRVAAAGITLGTSDGTYSPMQDVTRGEMAAFVRRAWDLPTSDTDYFSDDDGNIFEEDINAAAEAGVTAGADDDSFNPGGKITRGQMATFLSGAFGWS